jgi:YidC/Oxa1 family membrane protein insertase
MQDLQPEIKALRERIKDPNQLNQEVMALYQKRGVNPLGGCFPMVMQMPIFLGMYNALQRDIDLRHAPFALWVNDLSAPEGLHVFGIAIPVMILLMGASMLWQQVTTPSAADPAQKKAMYVVPVVFTVMFVLFPFPSGLVLYWLVNNVISIVQQMALRSEKGANPLKATMIGSVCVFAVAFVLTLL